MFWFIWITGWAITSFLGFVAVTITKQDDLNQVAFAVSFLNIVFWPILFLAYLGAMVGGAASAPRDQ